MNSGQQLSGCLVCQRTSHETPLLTLTYQGGTFHICPQHLPILIHDPHQLIGKLPGAEKLSPADHKD
ncbi:MAG: hypothetical protein FJ215_02535 [Ignavibacteria bacterium]|nr:hypothetical protein [Ignavibacteria bacterium]